MAKAKTWNERELARAREALDATQRTIDECTAYLESEEGNTPEAQHRHWKAWTWREGALERLPKQQRKVKRLEGKVRREREQS